MPELFHRLPQNIVAVFTGRNLVWHALAIVLTAAILRCGLDWSYFLATRGYAFALLARPGIFLGTFVPLAGTLIFLYIGDSTKNRRMSTTGWALGQAALLAYLVSCLYKAFTGRVHPPLPWESSDSAVLVDSSHGFRIGFLKGGVFWGWPSSHTTVAFATAVCLATLYPKNKFFVFLALLYAFYVGLGVSVTIHWLSEFVAGAIIGSVVGSVVGRNFKTNLV